MQEQTHSPLSAMSPVQMFLFGVTSGILVLCTIGFFILLGMVLTGNVSFGGDGKTVAYADNTAIQNAPSAPQGGAANQPVAVPPVDEKNDHIRGNKKAKVTLVEYSDFECPFCGRYYPTMKQVEKEYGSQVRIIYRHYPLSFHPQAQPAAEASECAAEQGKFWEFHDGVFENQERIGSALFTEVAGKIGLNTGKFNDCVSARKYQSKVAEQQAGGNSAGVQGTPHTIVLGANGETVPISGALPFEQVKAAIDSVL